MEKKGGISLRESGLHAGNSLICPVCEYKCREGSAFCPNCGTLLPQERAWRLPPEKITLWSEFFRRIGWFEPIIYKHVKEIIPESQIFSVWFPSRRERGRPKKVYTGKEWVKQGYLVGLPQCLLVFDHNTEQPDALAYEHLLDAYYVGNTIRLKLTAGGEWRFDIDIPGPSLLMVLLTPFADLHSQIELTKMQQEKANARDQFIGSIVQFFLEIIALQ